MHKMTFSSVLLLLLVIFITTNVDALRRGTMVGGRTEVKDVKSNKEIQKLGKFSVEEYNREILDMPPSPIQDVGLSGGSNGPLDFIKVVKAQTQVVSGIKYYLKVKAMQSGVMKEFDAVVIVQPWVHHQPKQLLGFSPSPTPRSNLPEAPSERM